MAAFPHPAPAAFVIEMANRHAVMLPAMPTAVTARATSRLVCAEEVHHALVHDFAAVGAHRHAVRPAGR